MLKRIYTVLAAVTLAGISHSNAVVLDLESDGSGTINGALFEVGSIHPAGTGVFDPFLTIQNSPWEQGYNSGSGVFDTKREPQWNHEIQFKDLQITVINNMQYVGFAIDVNEPNGANKAAISLNDLRIYTSPTLQNSQSTDANGFFNGSLGTLRYALGDNSVLYDDQHHGSGESDINIFVPLSFFDGTGLNDYVYMFQRWGNTDLSEGGFEETRLIAGLVIPELSSFFPLIGLFVAVFSTQVLRRRKLAKVSLS